MLSMLEKRILDKLTIPRIQRKINNEQFEHRLNMICAKFEITQEEIMRIYSQQEKIVEIINYMAYTKERF